MISKGNTHANPARLARYMTSAKVGEYAQLLDLRGFASRDIVEAFRTVGLIAAATHCRQPFMHVQVRNPHGESLTWVQWQMVADRIEESLGLSGQPRAIAVHLDRRTGHEHLHLAFSRIDEQTLKARPLPFFKLKLKEASRRLEIELGLTRVRNGRASVIPYAPTRHEDEQGRRLGIDNRAIREIIRDCFDRSDCGCSFRTALRQSGLVLAQGDRRDFVVVDRARGIHALGKRILGVSASELRTRLADLRPDELLTVDQVRRLGLGTELDTLDGPIASVPRFSPLPASCPKPEVWAMEMEDAAAAGIETSRRAVADSKAPVIADTTVCNAAITIPLPADCQAARAHHTAPTTESTAVRETVPSSPEPGPICDQSRESANRVPQTGVRETLRRTFRSVVKQLVGKPPVPSSKPRRRRREERGRSFRAFALTLFRRMSRTPVFDPLDPSWNAFTWLQLWEYNHYSETSPFQHCTSAVPPPTSLPQL